MAVTVVLPWTPFAMPLGLAVPDLRVMIAMAAILMAYLITADALKHWFFRHLSRRHAH